MNQTAAHSSNTDDQERPVDVVERALSPVTLALNRRPSRVDILR